VAAVFAAVSLVTLLAGLGLAIDIGRLYYAKRDLQRLADLAAIDGARMLSQCLGPAGADQISAEVIASLQRNGLPSDSATPLSTLGHRKSGADGVQTYQLWQASDATGPDAVQVVLRRPSPSRIMPLFRDEDAGTLRVQAAASATSDTRSSVSQIDRPELMASLNPGGLPTPLRARVAVGGSGGFADLVSTSVQVSNLVVDSSTVTEPLPDVEVPVPVSGLLTQLEDQLDARGQAAAAAAVSSYADVVDAGDAVVPSSLLGVPTGDLYGGATVSGAAVLDVVTGSLLSGQTINLPPVCDLVPALSSLPTEALVSLCDTTLSASFPQPPRIGSSTSASELVSVDTTESTDGASGSGGLLRVRLGLKSPISTQPLALPLLTEVKEATASAQLQRCAAVGRPVTVVRVRARGGTIRFGIGESGQFDAGFGAANLELGTVLDDLSPSVLGLGSLGDLLDTLGLSALKPLLGSAVLAQQITVSLYAPPVTLGDDREQVFEMSGSFPQTESIGSASSGQLASQLVPLVEDVQIHINLPSGLPALVSGPVEAALPGLETALRDTLQPLLDLIAAQVLEPTFQVAGLAATTATVKVDTVSTPPQVFQR
jgi:hypothetical protein